MTRRPRQKFERGRSSEDVGANQRSGAVQAAGDGEEDLPKIVRPLWASICGVVRWCGLESKLGRALYRPGVIAGEVRIMAN